MMQPGKTLLAIDPGGHTGVAYRATTGQIVTLVTTTPEELFELVTPAIDQVIIEEFSTAGRISRFGLYTVRLVGGVEALCWHLHLPLQVQSPQYRHPFQAPANEYMLAQREKFEDHQEDALAHLLAFEQHQREGGRIHVRRYRGSTP